MHTSAFECTKCYRRVLHISLAQSGTNISFLKRFNTEEDWLVKMIKHRKLKFFGHIKGHDSLKKTVLEGCMIRKTRPR